MELSPQTSRLVATSGKTVAFISALPNGPPTHSVTLPYSPSSASIHPILQDRFVTGSLTDEWVRVHTIDGEERDILKGHHGPVHCIEFSPDGELYASGSGAYPSQPSGKRLTNPSLCLLLRVVEDGKFYLSCCGSLLNLFSPVGTIRLWQTTPGKKYGLWQGSAYNEG